MSHLLNDDGKFPLKVYQQQQKYFSW